MMMRTLKGKVPVKMTDTFVDEYGFERKSVQLRLTSNREFSHLLTKA